MDLLLPKPLRIVAFLLAFLCLPANAKPSLIPGAAVQLILVTPDNLGRPKGRMRLYARADAAAPWKQSGNNAPIVGGVKGFAWGWDQTAVPPLPKDTLRKSEGDKRTPMGVFALGSPFGFSEDQRARYLRLLAGKTFCVDDLDSPEYGKIVDRSALPKETTGEDMATIPLYRSGFLVSFPANAERKSGSCIFLHVWRAPKSGTGGCIAMDASTMKTLQNWVKPGAVIAILPGAPSDTLAMLR